MKDVKIELNEANLVALSKGETIVKESTKTGHRISIKFSTVIAEDIMRTMKMVEVIDQKIETVIAQHEKVHTGGELH